MGGPRLRDVNGRALRHAPRVSTLVVLRLCAVPFPRVDTWRFTHGPSFPNNNMRTRTTTDAALSYATTDSKDIDASCHWGTHGKVEDRGLPHPSQARQEEVVGEGLRRGLHVHAVLGAGVAPRTAWLPLIAHGPQTGAREEHRVSHAPRGEDPHISRFLRGRRAAMKQAGRGLTAPSEGMFWRAGHGEHCR